MTNNIYFIANWKMYGDTSSINSLNKIINLSKLKKFKFMKDCNVWLYKGAWNEWKVEDIESFDMNDIGRISLRVSQPVFHDTYRRNRNTGSFILVDPFTNETLAAGMLR